MSIVDIRGEPVRQRFKTLLRSLIRETPVQALERMSHASSAVIDPYERMHSFVNYVGVESVTVYDRIVNLPADDIHAHIEDRDPVDPCLQLVGKVRRVTETPLTVLNLRVMAAKFRTVRKFCGLRDFFHWCF